MLKAISLFTGVGGLDFGFEAAGFDTAVAGDLDRVACDTLQINRPWSVLHGPIDDFDSATLLRVANLSVGEADVLIGGPPCQPFSKSSYWMTGDSKRLDDPRADTLASYLRVLGDALPKTFLLENVAGLGFKGKDEGLQHLLDGIQRINKRHKVKYTVSVAKLNAADFGVPQRRERMFLIGHREGRTFTFPSATHGERSDDLFSDNGLPRYRTAWDALADLDGDAIEEGLPMTGKWADLLPSIPEGENYLWHTPRGGGLPLFGWRTRYWSFLLKLAKNQPSWTIQAQPGSAIGPFHWSNRKLSTRELCRLQTFPDGLQFKCGRTDIQRLVGNAVPSLLAEVLAREIRAQLLDTPLDQPLKLLPPDRGAPPPPESVKRVPAKFRSLAGDHAPHPGTGLGVRARQLAESELIAE
ncbi:DNA (cytosine-5-)-methyltransferase [Burkholderia cenocepacia]|uniref:DNA cytosine methyltransferase n=1 Tax=Burkholderia cenocepacia TaxID=95486 RepID=UPI00196B3FEF|nr:DNA cytosine methyltransferase [Burkholderia cenocepacia]MBN3534229.1 DNA (cytosine-5-)-methyltransferase [Burkholderia cenocepacia]